MNGYYNEDKQYSQTMKHLNRWSRAMYMERMFLQIYHAIDARDWTDLTKEEQDQREALRDKLFPEFSELLKGAPTHREILKQATEKAASIGFPLTDVIDALLLIWLKGGQEQ